MVVCQVVYDVVQRIVHHVVEVERREARVEVGGNGRGADPGMLSARAAASCAASLPSPNGHIEINYPGGGLK